MNKSCKELKRLSRGVLVGNWSSVILAFFLVQIIVSIASLPFQGALNDYNTIAIAEYYTELGMTDYVELMEIPTMPTTMQLVLASVASIIISLASTVLSAGQMNIHLSLLRGEGFNLKKLFGEFKKRPDRYIVATLLLILIYILCMLPMIIGTILLGVSSVFMGTDSVFLIVIGIWVLFIISMIIMFYFTMKFSQVYFILLDNPETRVIASLKESARIMKGHYGRYLYMSLSFLPLLLVASLTIVGVLWVSPYMITVQAAFYMDITGEFQRREEEARLLEEEMGPVLSE